MPANNDTKIEDYSLIMTKLPFNHLDFYFGKHPATLEEINSFTNQILTQIFSYGNKETVYAIFVDPDEWPDDYRIDSIRFLVNIPVQHKMVLSEMIAIPHIPKNSGQWCIDLLDKKEKVFVSALSWLFIYRTRAYMLETQTDKDPRGTTPMIGVKRECFSTMWNTLYSSYPLFVEFIWKRLIDLYVGKRKQKIGIPFCIETSISNMNKLVPNAAIDYLDTPEHIEISQKNKNKIPQKILQHIKDISILWIPHIFIEDPEYARIIIKDFEKANRLKKL